MAYITVLQHELGKQAEDLKGLTLAVEDFQLQQQQQLHHEVSTAEGRCASLLRNAKAIEDKVNQACEEVKCFE